MGVLSCLLVNRLLRDARATPLGALFGMVLALVATASRTSADAKYMTVDEVKPGMKGYGLTVLKGTKPERFEVEVIATLENFRPRQDLFIVRTDHPRLEIARTVAGMSGSPIFIDGKMIGAYAYGWFFNVEPIAGVTPIHDMLADLRRPIPKELLPEPSRSPLGPSTGRPDKQGAAPRRRIGVEGHRFAGAPLDYDVFEHAKSVALHTAPLLAPPTGMGLRPATTDVMVGGLGPRAFKLASELLEPVGMSLMQAGGGGSKKTDPTAPEQYVDGGVITVQLVRGDVSMSGLGTVTHVVGDKLVAFGHPMLAGGISDLPTAVGKVHWILSTQNRSFKIGEPTTPLGSLVNDRQASIVVDTKRVAPTFPVTVTVEGAAGNPFPRWAMEVSHDQFLAPSFAAVGIGTALETAASERVEFTWRATSTVRIDGYPPFEVEDFGAGAGMPIGPGDVARSRMVRAVGALLTNPWKSATVLGIDTKVKVKLARDTLTLRGAQMLEPEIDAGQPARVRLTLEPHLGTPQTQVVEIPIPRSLAGESVKIRLSPSYMEERIVPSPESFDELVRVLPKLDFPGEALIATFELPDEAGTAFRGHVANRLPPGAANTLRAANDSISPELFAAQVQVVIPIKGFVIGRDNVEVKVRPVLR